MNESSPAIHRRVYRQESARPEGTLDQPLTNEFHPSLRDGQLPFRNQGADLVFCSLALHHFAEKDALTVLQEMARVGRHGTACIDLVRSRLAAFCIWLLTTFIIRDPMVRHDARLSVRRAFTDSEMKSLAHRAGWPNLKQVKFFWFQQAVLAHIKA